MLNYTFSTTKAKFKNKSCKIVKFLHWSFANAFGSMFCMYDLINPWITSVVMFEFLSECPFLCQSEHTLLFPASSPVCTWLLGDSAQPRLPVVLWVPKLNTALGSSSAEALPFRCSCYSSCLCSGLKLLAVGGRFSDPLHSLQTETLFLWTGHSLCLNAPDSRLLFKALLCVLPPLLRSGCTQGWCPGTPQAPKAAPFLLVLLDLTVLTASTGTCHCTGATVLFCI